MHPKDADGMANRVDPDKIASSDCRSSLILVCLFAETYLSQYIEFVRYFTNVMYIQKSVFEIIRVNCTW